MTTDDFMLPLSEGPEAFLAAYTQQVHPMRVAHGKAYWRFALHGDPEAHDALQELEERLSDVHASGPVFDQLSAWRDAPTGDPLVDRQVAILLPEYRQAQVDEKLRKQIIQLSLKVEETYSVFRPELEGRRVDSNELDRILLKEDDPNRRRSAWEASRAVGHRVADQVIRLVRLRNEMAQQLGFTDYFAMALDEQEMTTEQLDSFLGELQQQTDAAWAQRKSTLDQEFADARGKAPGDLQPWDYPERFLQSVPRDGMDRSTDAWFGLKAIQKHTLSFYRGIGIPVDSIWAASDMLPRDGKHPHAFCIGIDNPHDVRVLCNLDATARWMETTLHEFGHAIYDAGLPETMPWLLRHAAHTFITEAVAMFFGRLVRNPQWLVEVAGVPEERAAAAREGLLESQLVFARWAMTVTAFEQAMYQDPDSDLDSTWWRLCNELQGLQRPDNGPGRDWAAKIHVACYPAYYQNYILGELLASQFNWAVQRDYGDQWIGEHDVGTFFTSLFELGRALPWHETIRRHTGDPLSTHHWLDEFATHS